MPHTSPSWVRSSQSPGHVHDKTSCISPSHREDDPTEDWQGKHTSANLVKVVFWVCKLCSLSCASAEGKMWLLHRPGLRDQPSFSYCIFMGDVSSDIIGNIDDHIFSIGWYAI